MNKNIIASSLTLICTSAFADYTLTHGYWGQQYTNYNDAYQKAASLFDEELAETNRIQNPGCYTEKMGPIYEYKITDNYISIRQPIRLLPGSIWPGKCWTGVDTPVGPGGYYQAYVSINGSPPPFIPDSNKNKGKPACGAAAGNPVNIATGNKFQQEIDFQSTENSGPIFANRIYNSITSEADSLASGDNAFGPNWASLLDTKIVYSSEYYAVREDGRAMKLMPQDDGSFIGDSDASIKMTPSSDWTQYILTNQLGDVEYYDLYSGKLLSIVYRNGRSITISREIDRIKVSDNFGRFVTYLLNDAGLIAKSILPSGDSIEYQYYNNTLVKVTYPDAKERNYHYESPGNPTLLTGISDENGIRYATYTYDNKGRVISTEHVGGVNKMSIQYGFGGLQSVTNANNVTTSRQFDLFNGLARPISSDSSGMQGCDSAPKSALYDDRGNSTKHIDQNGNITTFIYDSIRNLETSRTEAYGSSNARTIGTQWHATLPLKTKISEPNRVTNFTYATNGNLTQKSITAGTTVRTWKWAYGNYGLLTSATDPNGKITKYAYDAMGNLTSITNPLNQVTQFTSYDANGRPLTIKDPNGLITTLSYTPRGWLKTRQVGTELTSFSYDGVGQLTKVTFPDGRFVSYTYDAAHRLTDIADSLGNKIHYTLDLMGNKLKEEIYDPSGALAAAMQAVDQSRQSPLPNPADAA